MNGSSEIGGRRRSDTKELTSVVNADAIIKPTATSRTLSRKAKSRMQSGELLRHCKLPAVARKRTCESGPCRLDAFGHDLLAAQEVMLGVVPRLTVAHAC